MPITNTQKTSAPVPAGEARLAAQAMAHMSWAKTDDRTTRTAPARAALEQKWLDAAGGDPDKAKSFRAAHYKRMQLKSLQSRRAKRS